MRISSFVATVFLGSLLAASTAYATLPVAPLHADAIRSQQAQIKAGIEAGKGVYKDLPAHTRAQLLAQQAVVLALIEGTQTTAELDVSQSSALFAALDSIDAMVNKANDERMVCKMSKKTGSNMKERVCLTAAQMREQEEAARSQIDRHGIDSIIQRN